MSEARRTTLLSAMVATAVAIGLLWRPVGNMADHIWGPHAPWTNGDFIGAFWLFWAAAQPEDWVARLNWPHGERSLWLSFPNPFDAFILGPLLAHLAFPAGWNAMMMGHHLANIAATVALARAAGARGWSAAAAGALVAASPVMLFEVGLGHTLTAAVWPGLIGLCLLLRGNGVWAGVLIGLQGLCYLYTGLAFGLAALLIRPHRGLAAALLVVAPYIYFLAPQLPAAQAIAPPDGYTGLPLGGLLWWSQQHQFRAHPLLLFGFLAPFIALPERRADLRRWGIVAVVLLVAAAGPEPAIARGDPLFFSPMAWVLALVPGMGRLHHPIRFVMVLLPVLAVGVAIALDRWPRWVAAIGLLLVLPTWRTMDDAVGWRATATPPGAAAAAWVGQRGTAVVDLGSRSMEGLALQPIHRLPVLAGFHPRRAPPPHIDAAVFRRVNAWADGQPQPGLPTELRALGFSHVLAIDRGPSAPIEPSAVEAALGPPVFPGVYAL